MLFLTDNAEVFSVVSTDSSEQEPEPLGSRVQYQKVIDVFDAIAMELVNLIAFFGPKKTAVEQCASKYIVNHMPFVHSLYSKQAQPRT